MNRTRFSYEQLQNDVQWYVVRTRRDADGDEVPIERWGRLEGAWIRHLRCPDASAYGLGTCHCRSHDPDTYDIVPL